MDNYSRHSGACSEMAAFMVRRNFWTKGLKHFDIVNYMCLCVHKWTKSRHISTMGTLNIVRFRSICCCIQPNMGPFQTV